MTWHVPATTMTSYVSGAIDDTDAWSVEAHLVDCTRCRDALTATAPAVAPDLVDVLDRTRSAVSGNLPAPGRVRTGTRFRQYVVLSRSASVSGLAWAGAALLVVVAAVLLEALAATSGGIRAEWPWLAILGPVIPVAGVAATYAAPWDDAGEVVAATPLSGIRLLLWRTLAILVAVVPLSVLASVVTTFTTSASWLVPAMVLTAITLALTSVTGAVPASAVVGIGWLAVVAVISTDTHGVDAVHDLVAAPSATLTWLAGGGIAAAVIYLRRAAYGSPSASLPTTSEEPW